jgi:hypothetical protein
MKKQLPNSLSEALQYGEALLRGRDKRLERIKEEALSELSGFLGSKLYDELMGNVTNSEAWYEDDEQAVVLLTATFLPNGPFDLRATVYLLDEKERTDEEETSWTNWAIVKGDIEGYFYGASDFCLYLATLAKLKNGQDKRRLGFRQTPMRDDT